MKTTMASSAALLVVLALALASAPLAAEAKRITGGAVDEESAFSAEEKQADSFCALTCVDKKGVEKVVCKESCDLSQRSNLVLYSRILCKSKCTEVKGITPEGMKVCEAKCDKEYVGKAAEVIAACAKACSKEKDVQKNAACRKQCSPPAS